MTSEGIKRLPVWLTVCKNPFQKWTCCPFCAPINPIHRFIVSTEEQIILAPKYRVQLSSSTSVLPYSSPFLNGLKHPQSFRNMRSRRYMISSHVGICNSPHLFASALPPHHTTSIICWGRWLITYGGYWDAIFDVTSHTFCRWACTMWRREFLSWR